jgi:hypothetical protein
VVVQISQRFDGNDFQVRDQGCFSGVLFGHGHAFVSIGAGSRGHRQDTARVTDDPVQRELADHNSILHSFDWQAPAQDDHAQSDGQVVGRAFLADRSRGQVDHDAVAREMQPGVLDGGLHALAAFLHGCIRQTDDDRGR